MSHTLLYTQRVQSAMAQTLVDAHSVYTHHAPMALHASTDLRSIGTRLIQLRKALEMSAADFARHLGFSTAALSNYETGYRRPQLDQAFVIVRKTGVTLDWIYFGDKSGLPLRIASKLPDESQEELRAG